MNTRGCQSARVPLRSRPPQGALHFSPKSASSDFSFRATPTPCACCSSRIWEPDSPTPGSGDGFPLTCPVAGWQNAHMRRECLTLLVAMVLMAGSMFPLPECYFTKVNCPRKATGSCLVFAGACQRTGLACGRACPVSQSCGEQQAPRARYELLKKLKFFPVRSLLSLGLENVSVFAVLADTSAVDRLPLRDARSTRPIDACERASPRFIQNQSLLI
jgi:hypothetical protein